MTINSHPFVVSAKKTIAGLFEKITDHKARFGENAAIATILEVIYYQQCQIERLERHCKSRGGFDCALYPPCVEGESSIDSQASNDTSKICVNDKYDATLSDDKLMDLWLKAGGLLHGPVNNIAVMKQEDLWPFLRQLVKTQGK